MLFLSYEWIKGAKEPNVKRTRFVTMRREKRKKSRSRAGTMIRYAHFVGVRFESKWRQGNHGNTGNTVKLILLRRNI